MMFWYGGGWAWWQAALMWVLMIAFWGLLVWVIYALVTSAARRPHGPQDEQPASPRQILDGRLARGEIDTAEYQRLRAILDDSAAGRSAVAAGSDGGQ